GSHARFDETSLPAQGFAKLDESGSLLQSRPEGVSAAESTCLFNFKGSFTFSELRISCLLRISGLHRFQQVNYVFDPLNEGNSLILQNFRQHSPIFHAEIGTACTRMMV